MKLETAIDLLRRGIAAGRLGHAYIIDGDPRREGIALAESVAAQLCCDTSTACGVCARCRHVRARTHPDVLWVYPEKKSRQITIDCVREDILPRVSTTSYWGGWKTTVVVFADRMNTAASNAFLKTLEEPSPRTLFLLLTDAVSALLPTVASRCRRLVIEPEPRPLPADIAGAVAGALSGMDRTALGALAAADTIAALFKRLKDEAERSIKAEVAEEAETLREDKEIVEGRIGSLYKEQRTVALRCMALWYRDTVAQASGAANESLLLPELRDKTAAAAAQLGLRGALNASRAIDAMLRPLELNVAESSVLTATLLSISRLSAGARS